MTRGSYDTKKKENILKIIKKVNKPFTVKEIYNKTDGIGLTTIYRMINNLANEGYLTKNISDDNVTYYQYLEKCSENNHFYLKCDCCGNLIHVDCDCIKDITNHILLKHHFILNKEKIIINGVCDECKNSLEGRSI